jgi:wyosine [tRNA(Phe)-imidazoG37] synthetase (radical SAM superfamily)
MSAPLPPINRGWISVRNHNRSYADFTFVYPVISRRSRGLSLGINLNPNKRCNFDCIYCEVDRRTPGKVADINIAQMGDELPALIRVAKSGELGRQPKFLEVSELTRDIRDLAFSGDGEPTMINRFAECVQMVADIKRAEGLDATKIVLITDAAGLDKADVKRGLEIMDGNQGEIWGKLDAGTEAYYRLVNRSTIRFDRILTNLLETARLRPIVIQTLLLKVRAEVMPAEELAAYCQRLIDLVKQGAQIKEVHAYTVARPTPETYATRLEPQELQVFADRIRQATGLKVSAFA